MTSLDTTKKNINLMFAAGVLISRASAFFKQDNNIYKHKTKRLINELYDESLRILREKQATQKELVSEQNLKNYENQHNKVLESDYVLEMFEDEIDLIVKLVSLYLKTVDHGKIVDTKIIIDEMFNDKKVYTETELLDKLKTVANYYSNFEISENNLKKFI